MRSTAIVMAPLCTMAGGEEERGCLKKIKFSLFNQGYLNEFLTIYPCCAFMISPQDWGGVGECGVNMRTGSWRLSRGHHKWRHKGIFLFYKELKEQKSGSLSTDPFSKTGSHGLISQSLLKIRTFILKCCLCFPPVVSSHMEGICFWAMGACGISYVAFIRLCLFVLWGHL